MEAFLHPLQGLAEFEEIKSAVAQTAEFLMFPDAWSPRRSI